MEYRFEMDVDTVALLGDLASAPGEFYLMQIDTVIRWLKAGCPETFRGESNGVIRFRIERNLGSDKRFDPLVVRDIRQFDGAFQRHRWNESGKYGHPATVLVDALKELAELMEGGEA